VPAPKFSNATFFESSVATIRRAVLCVLSQDIVEWVDVEAVADPPPISTSNDTTDVGY